ncbi:MAG: site-specific DNA-methyltransferase [Planctomycetes bacterium]|nr:site-specific DNA-methyltransferase [Planctomycetota bacterium]
MASRAKAISVVPQRNNAEANRLADEDRAAHDWYRFVLSFPPHLVRDYLTRFGMGPRHCVLDPFCGTGTTLVECKKQGVPSVGIEANPMAHFASWVKVDWSPDPDGLLRRAQAVAERVSRVLGEQGIGDNGVLPLWDTRPRKAVRLQGLPDERAALLLKDSISPRPLHKVLVLLDCLREQEGQACYEHQVLALAKALVFSVSNLHFGPEVGVGTVKADAPVAAPWLAAVRAMAEDLRHLRGNRTPSAAYRADAREVGRVAAARSVDAVITSPPYPNEKDYTRTTRLESVLLGFLRSKADLRALKEGLVRSNTRNVFRADDDDRLAAVHPEVERIAAAIEARRLELGKTSGFERMYARVARLYFAGMARHLANLRPVLRPGARLAYVVGDQASYLRVMIRTGKILADIAESLGYTLDGIDLFRTRLATATREQLREEVVLLRWPG